MSAVEQANKVMESMGWQPRVGCSCGGYWWYEHGEARGATHGQGCPHADAAPPTIGRGDGVCACGHSRHWHSHGGAGDCEYNAFCECPSFWIDPR